MNIATLSMGYLRARALNTVLNVLLLGLGVGTITLLLLTMHQVDERMTRDARGIDLVAGAKGSPMQVILSAIYHLDVPTGNIQLAQAREIAKHRMIKKTIPLALGDSYKGFRIVGTNHDYVAHYGGKPAAGRLWEKPMEAVIGVEVAQREKLSVGSKFTGAHGVADAGSEHADAPYVVVGVLAPTNTVLDRLVLASVESVWLVHDQHQGTDAPVTEEDKEITAMLIQYGTPLAVAVLPRYINNNSEMQAASPAYETARLFSIVGVGIEALRGFAAVLILAAGLSVFIALYSALEERRYELAVMRTLGASPGKLFGLLIGEAMVLSVLGVVLGLLLGHALASILGAWLERQQHYPVTGLEWRPEELWVAAIALGVGVVASIVPAWRAYRIDVSPTLARG